MFSESEVKEIASDIASEYTGELIEHPENITIKLCSGRKEMYIEWPKHDLAEVWMTFIQDGEDLYQDWFECMESEDKREFVQYVRSIPNKFFSQEVRVKRHGLIFRRYILESKHESGWGNIFE
ncbi:hypothetical protein J3369_18265 [Alteromonas sp. NFXS44]|uniref:hypothetical protein n=1 Tax=Alteromonas sp. NFXS44 TaxID=2818435 RepID=UPI0032DF5042